MAQRGPDMSWRAAACHDSDWSKAFDLAECEGNRCFLGLEMLRAKTAITEAELGRAGDGKGEHSLLTWNALWRSLAKSMAGVLKWQEIAGCQVSHIGFDT